MWAWKNRSSDTLSLLLVTDNFKPWPGVETDHCRCLVGPVGWVLGAAPQETFQFVRKEIAQNLCYQVQMGQEKEEPLKEVRGSQGLDTLDGESGRWTLDRFKMGGS